MASRKPKPGTFRRECDVWLRPTPLKGCEPTLGDFHAARNRAAVLAFSCGGVPHWGDAGAGRATPPQPRSPLPVPQRWHFLEEVHGRKVSGEQEGHRKTGRRKGGASGEVTSLRSAPRRLHPTLTCSGRLAGSPRGDPVRRAPWSQGLSVWLEPCPVPAASCSSLGASGILSLHPVL